MPQRRTLAILIVAMVALAAVAVVLIRRASAPVVVKYVTGAVLRDDADAHNQRPIEHTRIAAVSGAASGESASDASGFFRVLLRPPVIAGQPIRLAFRHPGFLSLELTTPAKDEILVVRLKPIAAELPVAQPKFTIGNVRLRYSLRSMAMVEYGSAARTFEVVNTGNVPCNGHAPCSPDGKWKAAVRSFSLDAGPDKQFRNARVSCIAGPCPFSRIESDQFSRGGRVIGVSVRNWSDTVTYLIEAEVAHTMGGEVIRHSYPMIFGRTMDFTLPAAAEGPSIEAEVDGADIVFPLGPSLRLSWANCRLEVGSDRTKLYRCELKPQYRFK